MKPLVLIFCAAVLLAAATPAGADTLFGVSEGPVDVTASVIWSDQTGATLHMETRNVPGQAGGPAQSAKIFANFADVTFIGDVRSGPTFNGDGFDPLFALAPTTRDVSTGLLQPGDSYTYTYQLTVRGRTAGAEHGFLAFLGHPF